MALDRETKRALNLLRFRGYIGTSLGDLIDEAIQTDPMSVFSGTVDPSIDAGVVANPGDLYRRDTPGAGGGELWVKTGDLSTDWALVNTAAAGAGDFVGLSDTPADFTGQSLKAVRVNAGETALEFVAFPSGADNLGNHTATQDLQMQGFGLDSNVVDGAGAVAHILDTDNVINTPGSKLLSVRSNGVERAYIGAATSAWGVTGTRLELDRQAGGDAVIFQAESGFSGNFSTIEPENPWSFGVHTAKDWAGFVGGVTEWSCSPDGAALGSFYGKLGATEITNRVWDWGDLEWIETNLYRSAGVGTCTWRVHGEAAGQGIAEIRLTTSDVSELGIADSQFRVIGGGLVSTLASGPSGTGILGSLKINSTKILGPQGAAVADATDAASVILRLNDLLARCRAHGIIA